jgi:protease-4
MSRRLAIWIFVAVGFVAAVVAIGFAADEAGLNGSDTTLHSEGIAFKPITLQDGSGPTVAVVPVSGVIVDGNGNGNGTVGGDELVALLDHLESDDRIEGIVLEMNTPGGAVLASAEVADRVRSMDTPVVAWMRESSASGGYYISSAADKIVAHRTTITGSIGVILEYVNAAGLADKVGVKPVIVKSGKLKDMGSPFRALTPEERDVLQNMIDEAYADFVKAVAKGRDMSIDDVKEIADGRLYTGLQASKNGLVDTLGGRAEAYDAIARLIDDSDGDDLNVVRYEQHFDFWSALTSAKSNIGSNQLQRAIGVALGAEALDASPLAPQLGSSLPTLEYRAVL